jgi:hypothetical protein
MSPSLTSAALGAPGVLSHDRAPGADPNSPAFSVEPAAAEVDLQLRILPGAIRASAQRTRAQAAMLLGPRSVAPRKGGPRDPGDVLEEAVRVSTLCL